MFYGPSGSGKKTRIMCVLRELYGPGAEKLKIQQQTFTVRNYCIRGAYHQEKIPYTFSEIQKICKQFLKIPQNAHKKRISNCSKDLLTEREVCTGKYCLRFFVQSAIKTESNTLPYRPSK